jgi:segregation and condensation protein B
MPDVPLKLLLEAALLAAGRPLDRTQLLALFEEDQQPSPQALKDALAELDVDYADRSMELVETASGYRLQVRQSYSAHLGPLWEERKPRYSRALLETLAIIAYRQPVTRGEIEAIRGVAVATNIIKTLSEREWIRVVGHRDVPGRPSLYATTRHFLDDFQLKRLQDLPSLAEIRDIEGIDRELDLAEAVPVAPLAEAEDNE